LNFIDPKRYFLIPTNHILKSNSFVKEKLYSDMRALRRITSYIWFNVNSLNRDDENVSEDFGSVRRF